MKKWQRIEKKRFKREALHWRRFQRRGGCRGVSLADYERYADYVCDEGALLHMFPDKVDLCGVQVVIPLSFKAV